MPHSWPRGTSPDDLKTPHEAESVAQLARSLQRSAMDHKREIGDALAALLMTVSGDMDEVVQNKPPSDITAERIKFRIYGVDGECKEALQHEET